MESKQPDGGDFAQSYKRILQNARKTNMNVIMFTAKDVWFLFLTHAKIETEQINTGKLMHTNKSCEQVITGRVNADRYKIIDSLIRAYSDRLFRIISRMAHSHTAAEDILQDTWVLVMRKFHLYDPSRPIFPWLTRIAVNCCRSYWRHEHLRSFFKRADIYEKTKGLLHGKEQDVPYAVENRHLALEVLERLSLRLREVVVLKFYSGLTYEEMAEVLKTPVGTIKSRLNYAINKMREIFDEGRIT